MDRQDFTTKVRRLHPMQSVTLVFAQSGMTGLFRLSGLLGGRTSIRLADRDKTVMGAVCMSRDWGVGVQNRTYTVYGLSTVDEGWLMEIGKDVESITVADHRAKGLMSKRQKVHNDTAQELRRLILYQGLDAEMDELGIGCYSSSIDLHEGLPCLTFELLYGVETITKVLIDGWSGRIWTDGVWGDEMFTPGRVQKIIRDRMEAWLDKITASA